MSVIAYLQESSSGNRRRKVKIVTKCNSYNEFVYKEKPQDGTLAEGMWS